MLLLLLLFFSFPVIVVIFIHWIWLQQNSVCIESTWIQSNQRCFHFMLHFHSNANYHFICMNALIVNGAAIIRRNFIYQWWAIISVCSRDMTSMHSFIHNSQLRKTHQASIVVTSDLKLESGIKSYLARTLFTRGPITMAWHLASTYSESIYLYSHCHCTLTVLLHHHYHRHRHHHLESTP